MTQIVRKEAGPSLSTSEMSRATRDALISIRKMIPPLLPKFYKGQMGSVAVIGGSQDYTGAPYFSAMACAKTGADLVHVICEPQAAQVIKTYSPNLMVHPLMRQSDRASTGDSALSIATKIIELLPRLHVLVIGPGLGRDKLMLDTCVYVIEAAKKLNMPLVIDADGLSLAQTNSGLFQNYTDCIMTPNLREFSRLCESKNISPSSSDGVESVERLSLAFGGVTIIQKGMKDFISNGKRTMISDIEGGLKRSGGQGDSLTGSLATFLCWRKAYLDKIWDHSGDLNSSDLLALAAYGGSALTRECSRLAYLKKGRSMQASDMLEEVHGAFQALFESSLTDPKPWS
ncbi:unnamed protein product [Blumeria hordei]|uniref:ATP-dependent (S)-NAD(P)H-hydrate dehydratase n=2 Tax=Blumeria hordei TaxID=2867405 RepID=A0A383UZT0_BLUHO|nr:unnamed protein product [Blumeria hordei]